MERDLESVYAVYRTGSFSKAAKYLFASQPAVSMAIQRVEENLGYSVFDRGTHPLRLTEEGEILIRHLERIRESERNLRAELDRKAGLKGDSLRLGCSPLKSAYLIPEVISRFRQMEPDTEITVVSSFRQGMLRDLKEHRTDLAINTFLDTDRMDFTYIPVCELRYLLEVPENFVSDKRLREVAMSVEDILSGKHLQQNCPRVPVSLFREVPFVVYSEGTELYEQSRKIFSESDFRPDTKVTVSSPVMANELARKGVGAALVGDYMVTEGSSLLYYNLRTRWERRAFYFVLRKDEQLQPPQKRFIELCRDYMRERGLEGKT